MDQVPVKEGRFPHPCRQLNPFAVIKHVAARGLIDVSHVKITPFSRRHASKSLGKRRLYDVM